MVIMRMESDIIFWMDASCLRRFIFVLLTISKRVLCRCKCPQNKPSRPIRLQSVR